MSLCEAPLTPEQTIHSAIVTGVVNTHFCFIVKPLIASQVALTHLPVKEM